MKIGKLSTKHIMVLAITFAFLALIFGIFITPYIGVSRSAGGTTGSSIVVKEIETQLQWEQLAQLNVFDDVAVSGDEFIAPASSGVYPFTISNDARFALKYNLDISDENLVGIPMVFRLSTESGTYLCGSENLWVPIDSLQSVSGDLAYQATDGYVLEWKWAEGKDELDTSIGVLAQGGVVYALNFDISAVQNGPVVGYGIGPVTSGDISIAAFWIAAVLIGFIALFALLCVSAIERRNVHEI